MEHHRARNTHAIPMLEEERAQAQRLANGFIALLNTYYDAGLTTGGALYALARIADYAACATMAEITEDGPYDEAVIAAQRVVHSVLHPVYQRALEIKPDDYEIERLQWELAFDFGA